MPATVPTSLRGNRSVAMVIMVTDRVWWAKPARLISATAIKGSCTTPVKATPIIISAPQGEGAAPGIDQVQAASLQEQHDRRPEDAAQVGRQEGQPGIDARCA